MKHIFIFLVLSTMFSACSKSELENEQTNPNEGGIRFKLEMNSEFKLPSATRTSINNLEIVYLLSDLSGEILTDYQSTIIEGESTLLLGSLDEGDYKLYVLAYDRAMLDGGLVINQNITSVAERWFSFEGENFMPQNSGDLVYGSTEFSVRSDADLSATVQLNYLLTGIVLDRGNFSPYLNKSIQSLEINLTGGIELYSDFVVDGTFSGSIALTQDTISMFTTSALYSMPSLQSSEVKLETHIKTLSHDDNLRSSSYNTEILLRSNRLNTVTVDMSRDPDYNLTTYWFEQRDFQTSNIKYILQDDEPKSIFYNSNFRSFYVNEPLQIRQDTIDASKLMLKLYSPVGMSDVTILAQRNSSDEKIPIAYFDTIPAFMDFEMEFTPNANSLYEFRKSSGVYVSLNQQELQTYLDGQVSIESSCEFWQKVKTIEADWWIRFHHYNGDPDAPDGAPDSHWMGMRPVHIREAIAMMLNASFMIAMPEYADSIASFQGQLYDDKLVDVDVSTLIPRLRDLAGFNMGLVYSGNLVVGLGGGSTLGLTQSYYLKAYEMHAGPATLYHEIGHILGYGHSSNMTYGLWEQFNGNYYLQYISRFPVYDKKILNSLENPNIYITNI